MACNPGEGKSAISRYFSIFRSDRNHNNFSALAIRQLQEGGRVFDSWTVACVYSINICIASALVHTGAIVVLVSWCAGAAEFAGLPGHCIQWPGQAKSAIFQIIKF